MSFTGLLSRMLVLLALICEGVLCSKLYFIDEKGSASINKLVLYVCGPLMIIKSVQNVQLDYGLADILMILLYSIFFILGSMVIGVVFGRLICGKKPIRGVFSLVAGFGNIFFMGVPVVSALYGDSTIFLLSVCVMPFNLFVFTFGIYLILSGKQKIPWKRIIVNPSLYATILALAMFFLRIELPGTVTEIIGYLSQMVVPLSMILIGAALGRMSLRAIFGNGLSYVVCAVKLIVSPLVIFAIFRLFVKDPLILGIFAIIAAMPSASISPILCAEYGGDSEFASRTVFLTTVLSLVTIPFMIWLLLL